MGLKRKYTVSLMLIFCALLLCIFILLQYNAYQKRQEVPAGITIVNEFLSVNYENGKTIDGNTKEVKFSITNQTDETVYYYIHLKNITGVTDGVTYDVTSELEDFESISADLSRTVILERMELKPNSTHRYQMNLENPLHREVSFDIEIDTDELNHNFANTIISQNEVTEDRNATGLIEQLVQFGSLYYFHGNVTNNYVSFAGLTWRIVNINEDKTVKLILNNTTEEFVKMSYQTEEAKEQLTDYLQNWYKIYLEKVDSYIASTLYCYDDSIMTDENNRIDYLANVRIFNEKIPSHTCGGTNFSQKIALLTADEAMYAGAITSENKDYYLYSDSIQSSWWTMTPSKKENEETYYMAIASDGSIQKDISETSNLFVRPVITLNKKITVTGSGTQQDPYIVETS